MDIREYLGYNPETGDLTWIKAKSGVPLGKCVKTLDHYGYIVVRFNWVLYKAHRVAWYLHYGEWPEGEIDHINGVRHDNRIENLRAVTHRENLQNSPLFNFGATFDRGKWSAAAKKGSKRVYLGRYNTKEEAQEAYLEYVRKLE